MIIAVASEKEQITGHFGHCRNFNLFTVEGDKIVSEVSIDSPGHEHGDLPAFLKEYNVDVLISGGMGPGAFNRLNEVGIIPVVGGTGLAKDVAADYAAGKLVSGVASCGGHGGHGDHHDHGGHHHGN